MESPEQREPPGAGFLKEDEIANRAERHLSLGPERFEHRKDASLAGFVRLDRAGAEPAKAILKCRERLYDIHLKDVKNITPKGSPLECGRGVLNLKAVCKNLIEIGYKHHVGFEYEKDGTDPLPGLAESVGYVHGVLASLA